VKHTLGSIWILLLFVWLQAEDFSHQFKINKPTPYVKEAVLLTLDLNQTNHNVVLLFDFDILPSEDYSFQRIGIEESDAHHALGIHYIYLLYPLHAGEIKIKFKLTKKVTTDDSVAYSFSGDRDNVKGLVTKDYPITLPAQILHVKVLPKETQLVGDFTLNYTLKKHQAKAYEALPLHITIKGKGYPPLLPNIIPKSDKYTLFTEKPLVHSSVNTEGTQTTISYPMALLAKESFYLDPIEIQAFNPKTKQSYLLTIPEQNFTITQVSTEHLIDKVNTPPLLKSDFRGIQNFFSYFIVFMAGFLTATLIKWQKRTSSTAQHPLIKKIEKVQEPKALLQLLMATDSHRFAPCIEALEKDYYKHGKINLGKVKKEAIDLI